MIDIIKVNMYIQAEILGIASNERINITKSIIKENINKYN